MKFTSSLSAPFLLLSCLLALAVVGCADGEEATQTAGAAVNSVCPIMGGEVDGETFVEWNGKTVGFCCPPCVDEWNSMTDEERTAALAGKKASDHGDHADHADHGDHGGHADHGEEGHDHSEVSGEESAESGEGSSDE